MKPYYSDTHVTIYHGDCREVLALLDAGSVQTCVTSPPYFGLRDYGGGAWVGGDEGCDHLTGRFTRGGLSSKQASNYGSAGDEASRECGKCGATRQDQQIGLEPTPAAYVAEMTGVFEEVKRVLRDDSTFWLNLGDSYSQGGNGPGSRHYQDNCAGHGTATARALPPKKAPEGYKPKDLLGIPWRVAFALQDAGWWLRSDIIWSKGNPMPESVQDRPTKAHEYLFLLAKAERYYYDADAIREDAVKGSAGAGTRNYRTWAEGNQRIAAGQTEQDASAGRNRRSVWTINTQPYAGAHFAVFPEKLIEPCILAGCPAQVCAACGAPWVRLTEKGEPYKHPNTWGKLTHLAATEAGQGTNGTGKHSLGMVRDTHTTGFAPTCHCNAGTTPGTVLDCFAGSGTTGRVAKRLGRRAILIEQNERYCDMAASSLLQQAFEVFA